MITLSLNTPEELAEAIYLSELSIQIMEDTSHHMTTWEDLSEETKTLKVKAAARLIASFKVSSLPL